MTASEHCSEKRGLPETVQIEVGMWVIGFQGHGADKGQSRKLFYLHYILSRLQIVFEVHAKTAEGFRQRRHKVTGDQLGPEAGLGRRDGHKGWNRFQNIAIISVMPDMVKAGYRG